MADDQDILYTNFFPHGFPIFCGIIVSEETVEKKKVFLSNFTVDKSFLFVS